MTDRPDNAPRPIGGELIIPVLAVVFTLYFISTILDSPWTAQVNAFMIGGILLFLCLIFFIRAVLSLRSNEATLGFGNVFSRDDWTSGRIGLLITTIAYAVLIEWGGFTLTTFLFLAVSMAILNHGKRLGLITLISAAMAFSGWALFIWAFDTRFPRGWFEGVMQSVLSNG